MITVTVETKGFGKARSTAELYFNEVEAYKHWRLYWKTHPNSNRIVHSWGRSIKLKSITRIISVEDDRVITKGRN
ncbi:hypothetical protein CN937_03995 [Bacillus thuringiensis]|nr:hypothetical protein CN937_03995 [Bacillus thuringiensis]